MIELYERWDYASKLLKNGGVNDTRQRVKAKSPYCWYFREDYVRRARVSSAIIFMSSKFPRGTTDSSAKKLASDANFLNKKVNKILPQVFSRKCVAIFDFYIRDHCINLSRDKAVFWQFFDPPPPPVSQNGHKFHDFLSDPTPPFAVSPLFWTFCDITCDISPEPHRGTQHKLKQRFYSSNKLFAHCSAVILFGVLSGICRAS